ncbi:MAG TPA: alpha/beta fold hydrolase, partial [Candidatus Angelobacter sp.]|nr:alpha/beta fold hydrolase [Candidatus Angelobacter sp.]
KESDDIHRWVSWMFENDPPRCIYGFGESYGAALILQSLAAEKRYCAIVAESPFSTAHAMSYERVSGPLHLGPWFGYTLGRPVIWSAVLYARLRYNVELLKPSPLEALTHSTIPVLLIHGENDRNIAPVHSRILAAAAPDHVQLWLVPHAGHTMAWTAAHDEFEQRVLGWFSSHTVAQDKSGSFCWKALNEPFVPRNFQEEAWATGLFVECLLARSKCSRAGRIG